MNDAKSIFFRGSLLLGDKKWVNINVIEENLLSVCIWTDFCNGLYDPYDKGNVLAQSIAMLSQTV